jgi:hypothetical protein
MILAWLRRRGEGRRLATADAEALIREYGDEAYYEARERERDVILPDGTTHQGRTTDNSLKSIRTLRMAWNEHHGTICSRREISI